MTIKEDSSESQDYLRQIFQKLYDGELQYLKTKYGKDFKKTKVLKKAEDSFKQAYEDAKSYTACVFLFDKNIPETWYFEKPYYTKTLNLVSFETEYSYRKLFDAMDKT